MQITLDISESLWTRLNALEQSLSQVLEVGLDELVARPQPGFTGFAEVLEFLANLPTPEEILAMRPSEALQAQIEHLAEKHQAERKTVSAITMSLFPATIARSLQIVLPNQVRPENWRLKDFISAVPTDHPFDKGLGSRHRSRGKAMPVNPEMAGGFGWWQPTASASLAGAIATALVLVAVYLGLRS